MLNRAQHDAMANAIRALSMDAVEAAKSGHPGLPMGAADIATVLFRDHLKYDPADPAWPDRDRFILSAGHGSMLLYSLLHLIGVKGVTLDDLKAFRQLGSKTPGHPEYGHTEGVETTTGPLGQGLAMSVGFAMGERLLAHRFGKLVNHHTYVLATDGDLMEGISQEGTYKDIIFTIAEKMSVSKPSIEAKSWLLNLGWRLDGLFSFVFRTKRKLSKQAAQSLQNTDLISNEKVKNELNYNFEPIDSNLDVVIDFIKKV